MSKHSTMSSQSKIGQKKYHEPLHYPFTAGANNCGGNYNTIDVLHAQICVPGKVKNNKRKRECKRN